MAKLERILIFLEIIFEISWRQIVQYILLWDIADHHTKELRAALRWKFQKENPSDTNMKKITEVTDGGEDNCNLAIGWRDYLNCWSDL